MRTAVVSLIVVLLAGCSPATPVPVLIEGFVERSPLLECKPAALEQSPAMVNLLEEVNDSLLIAIAPLDREVTLLTHDLRPARRIRYQKEGPSQLIDPQDVVVLGDTLLVFADRPLQRLKLLGLGGEDRGAIELGFPPERLLPHGGGLLVAPLIALPSQTELLYMVAGDDRRPLGVSPIPVADWQLSTLANLVMLEPAGSGRFILAHQFLEPTAHLVDFREGSRDPVVRSVPIPLPDGVRDAVGRLPTRPFTEEALMQILTPVLDAAADRASGDILYLTRSGRQADGYTEKALVRVDRELRYLESYRFPVNVGRIAYLSRSREIIAVGEDDRWYRCPL